MVRDHGDPVDGESALLDVDEFLDFNTRLHRLHELVAGAAVPEDTRARWKRRLVRIADLATRDLESAGEQVSRMGDELDRVVAD